MDDLSKLTIEKLVSDAFAAAVGTMDAGALLDEAIGAMITGTLLGEALAPYLDEARRRDAENELPDGARHAIIMPPTIRPPFSVDYDEYEP